MSGNLIRPRFKFFGIREVLVRGHDRNLILMKEKPEENEVEKEMRV